MKNSYFKNYYEKVYNEWIYSTKDIRFVINSPYMWNFIKGHFKDGMTIVDLGAGMGSLLYNINKVAKSKLIAIELSDIAIKNINKILPEVIVLKEDVLETDLEENSVDFCLCTMLIEHVDDHELLKEVKRILKSNGYFFVSSIIKSRFAWSLHVNDKGDRVLDPTHLHEYKNSDEFLDILNDFNFKILKYKVNCIKHPIIDTFIKLILKLSKQKKRIPYKMLTIIEMIRRLIRLPIPGYYTIEVLAQK